MLMTPEEAQTKWCPFSNTPPSKALPTPSTVGRRLEAAGNSTCLADSCAVWRWWADPKGEQPGDYSPMGFCGMAGRP
ncbi:MAG: hypothetical protein OEW11_01270 [Nitrospirota bacterium]|nr:hypothetical protein [Nitrospirota bacterium]